MNEFEQGRESMKKEILEIIKSRGEIYPLKIWSPPWEGWQKDVDDLAKTKDKRIDNISADYGKIPKKY